MTRAKPKQDRSRETEARLIAASLNLLRKGGLEAFTVPALAAEAGVAVGTLYRRFADKAALLQQVFEALIAASETCDPQEPFPAKTTDIAEFVDGMVSQLVVSCQTDARIFFALQQFARTHPDPQFRKRVLASGAAGRLRLARALAELPQMKAQADGAEKAQFAVFSCTLMLRAALLDAHDQADSPPTVDAEQLVRQLKAMLLAYLL